MKAKKILGNLGSIILLTVIACCSVFAGCNYEDPEYGGAKTKDISYELPAFSTIYTQEEHEQRIKSDIWQLFHSQKLRNYTYDGLNVEIVYSIDNVPRYFLAEFTGLCEYENENQSYVPVGEAVDTHFIGYIENDDYRFLGEQTFLDYEPFEEILDNGKSPYATKGLTTEKKYIAFNDGYVLQKIYAYENSLGQIVGLNGEWENRVLEDLDSKDYGTQRLKNVAKQIIFHSTVVIGDTILKQSGVQGYVAPTLGENRTTSASGTYNFTNYEAPKGETEEAALKQKIVSALNEAYGRTGKLGGSYGYVTADVEFIYSFGTEQRFFAVSLTNVPTRVDSQGNGVERIDVYLLGFVEKGEIFLFQKTAYGQNICRRNLFEEYSINAYAKHVGRDSYGNIFVAYEDEEGELYKINDDGTRERLDYENCSEYEIKSVTVGGTEAPDFAAMKSVYAVKPYRITI